MEGNRLATAPARFASEGAPHAVANFTLEGHPASVGEARRAVAAFASANGMGADGVDAARLLVSETVTNALVHAGHHAVGLEMSMVGSRLRVEVADLALGRLTRRDPCAEDEGGRGLALLDAVATEWGCRARAGGKVVWFELAL